MILLRYSGKLIAMSGNETTTYVSENNGVVWKNYQELKLPLTGSDFSATVFDKYIYLFAGEEARYTKINE